MTRRTVGRYDGKTVGLRRRVALFILLTVLPSHGLTGQSDPRLVAAVRLAQDGLADSARAVVSRLLAATQATDSLYPEVLYTAALVAATEAERRSNLRLVAVEYSQSDWADDALLLLGQLEFAKGNPAGTVREMDKLLSDYPTSPLLAIGAFWGARAASDVRNPALACKWADLGLTVGGNDIELKNQLGFQKQRCTGLLAQIADSVRAAAARDSIQAAARPPTRPGFRVQVIAAPTQQTADRAVASLKQMKYDAIVLREGGLHKVRAGPFATRAEALAALRRIRTRLGGQPFLVAEP